MLQILLFETFTEPTCADQRNQGHQRYSHSNQKSQLNEAIHFESTC